MAQVEKLIKALASWVRPPTVTPEGFEQLRWSLTASLWCTVAGPDGHSSGHPPTPGKGGRRMSSRGIWQKYLCHRSRSYIDKLCVRGDLQEIVSAAHVSAAPARQELDGVAASFRDALSKELQSASQAVSASTAGGAEWSLPFVILSGRGKGWTQVVANRALKMLPVFEWKADCGWKFGLAEYTFSPIPGPPVRRRGEGHTGGHGCAAGIHTAVSKTCHVPFTSWSPLFLSMLFGGAAVGSWTCRLWV